MKQISSYDFGPSAFRELSREIVGRFLQTVVVLDDRARMGTDEEPISVVEPVESAEVVESSAESASASEVLEPTGGPLEAGELMKSFAARGLVCAVLAPSSGRDGSEETLSAARRADIVILDWQLEDDGEQATGIIRELVQDDARAGGRLRMIAVYTANPNLEAIRESVRSVLSGFEATERPGNVLALKRDQTSILFIRKGTTSDLTGAIDERDLPDRLIDEFVDIGKGIIANVALCCIAAIREDTHRVLARFHRGMDAPFLTHRILLERPEDAEDYAVDLLGSELLAVLDQRTIASRYADREAIQLALTELEDDGVEFHLMKQSESAENALRITVGEFMKLIDAGPLGLVDIADVAGGSKAQKQLYQRLYLLIAGELNVGIAAHHEFARVSAHAREQHLMSPSYRARLDLGTIIREDNQYLMCIQPSCDAVGLEGSTQFIFAPLYDDTTTFDVVIRGATDEEICLRANTKASQIRTITFNPDPGSGIVLSSAEAGIQSFRSTSNGVFIWVGDLKVSFAQRFAHRVASNLSRIGLDEFEWQRRHAAGV